MEMQIPLMQDLDLQGLRTMIRLDLNVPIKNGAITEASRIKKIIPTIKLLLEKQAKQIEEEMKQAETQSKDLSESMYG